MHWSLQALVLKALVLVQGQFTIFAAMERRASKRLSNDNPRPHPWKN
jgi:hypothetical protein